MVTAPLSTPGRSRYFILGLVFVCVVVNYMDRTTVAVAEQLKRQWKGCDLSAEYCQWAADRMELVEDWPLEKWLRYDEQNAERRKSIR